LFEQLEEEKAVEVPNERYLHIYIYIYIYLERERERGYSLFVHE